MGLQGATLPVTPPKTPLKKGGVRVGAGREHFSSTKRMSPDGEKHTTRSPRRPETAASVREHGYDTPERKQQQGDAMKVSPLMPSPVYSQDSDSYLVDFSTLCYADAARNTVTPVRASRFSGALQAPQHTRGRLGQAVRNFVRRMLPPSSGGAFSRSSGRQNSKGGCSPPRTEGSDASGESGWTFASAGRQQAGSRWSGLWD